MTLEERLDAALQGIHDRIPTDAEGRKIYNPHGHFVERIEDLPIVKEGNVNETSNTDR